MKAKVKDLRFCVARWSALFGIVTLAGGLAACATAAPHRPAKSALRSAAAGSPGSTAAGSASRPLLEVGIAVERPLEAGAVHDYPLSAAAGWYLRLAIRSADLGVDVRLLGPTGELVALSEAQGGNDARLRARLLSLVTRAAGEYRVQVSAHEPRALSGHYRLELEELRSARPSDAPRVAAERVWEEAESLQARQEAGSALQALARLAAASALWDAAGDCRGKIAVQVKMGDLARLVGRVEEALTLTQEGLALATREGDVAAAADALYILGHIHGALGDSRGQLDDYTAALALREALGDDANLASNLYSLGVAANTRGDPEQALGYYRQALALRDRIGDRALLAIILASVGLAHETQGETGKALSFFEESLAVSRAAGNRISEAFALQETAGLLLRLGKLQEALGDYRRALALAELLGDRQRQVSILLGLGAAYLYVGDSGRALAQFERAESIARDLARADLEARALFSIGWIHGRDGAPPQALASYHQALALAGDPRLRPLILYGIGRAELALGRTGEAIASLTEAQKASAAIGDSNGEAQSLLDLGRAFEAAGDRGRAAREFRSALALGDQHGNLIVRAYAEAAMARLSRDRGDLAAARAGVERALQVTESVRTNVVTPSLRVSFLAARRDYYEFYVDLLLRMHEREPAAVPLAEAFAGSERARARGLLDLLAEGRIDVRSGIDPELKRRETELNERIARLEALLASGAGQGRVTPATAPEKEWRAAEEEWEQLELEIRRRNPRYAEVVYPQPRPAAAIQRLLDGRTALLEYLTGSAGSFLFVVRRDGLTAYRLPAAAELEELVGRVQAAARDRGHRLFGSYVLAARRLHALLVAPAAAVLGKEITHLIVSPDGPLLALNFELLLTSPPATGARLYRGLPFLILSKTVSYVPSASVLLELAEPRPVRATAAAQRKLFVGFGDPDYRQPRAGRPAPAGEAIPEGDPLDVPRLAESRHEIEGIAGLYSKEQVALYLGADATKRQVLKGDFLSGARRIHFATHGFVNQTLPELSGLLLAKNPLSGENELLQVQEMFDLELSAELVVLSACDSGRGKVVSGEGLIGMSRALLYAGAASVLVSLWPVDDRSTPGLMIDFYRQLESSGDRAESLRQAKLALIRRGDYDHPFYWASFILIGPAR